MSDTDHLRAAADELDHVADHFPEGGDPQNRATAALLRAVADLPEHGPMKPYGVDCWQCDEPAPCPDAKAITAALALADALLGGAPPDDRSFGGYRMDGAE